MPTRAKAFYDSLGVYNDATPEEIRKAYRRRALELHPDKCGNTREAQDEFTRMKHAYDVLSDTRKRKIYDKAGEDGIKLLEEYNSLGPDELVAAMFGTLGAIGMKGKCCVMLVLTLLISFLISIPILWCLRADKAISWNWIVVFLPLWILDVSIYSCIGLSYINANRKKDPMDRKNLRPLLYQLYQFGKSLLIIILQMAIALRLNAEINWSVKEILLPYFMFEILSLVDTAAATLSEFSILQKQSEKDGIHEMEVIVEQKAALIQRLQKHLAFISLRLLQAILIGAKLDADLGNLSWWIVFIPTWLIVGYFVAKPLLKYKNALQKQEKALSNNHESLSSQLEEEASNMSIMDVIYPLAGIAILASPYFILSARLQSEHFSTLYILLPWLILVGLILCMLNCIIACLGFATRSDDMEIPLGEGNPSEDSFSDRGNNDLEAEISPVSIRSLEGDKRSWSKDSRSIDILSPC